MADIGRITLKDLRIIRADADPSVSGVAAPIGSLAMLPGTPSSLFKKDDAADTDWVEVGGTPPAAAASPTVPSDVWYAGQVQTSSTGSSIPLGVNLLIAVKASFTSNESFNRIGIQNNSAGTVDAFGIYDDAGGYPGDLLVSSGAVVTTGTGFLSVAISTFTASDTISYWIVFNAATSHSIRGAAIFQGDAAENYGFGSAASPGGTPGTFLTIANPGAGGTLPATYPGGATYSGSAFKPLMFRRTE